MQITTYGDWKGNPLRKQEPSEGRKVDCSIIILHISQDKNHGEYASN